MSSNNKLYTYGPDHISFTSEKATQPRTIYFPLCGIGQDSIKSSITPYLSGDIKIDKNRYLTKPASTEDLRNNLRNFFVVINEKQTVSFVNEDEADSSHVEAGQLWYKLVRDYEEIGLQLESLNFVPVDQGNVELMRIRCTNNSKIKMTVVPTAAVPIFGRALANKHDHEHVTSLLHRIEQGPHGVLVKPSMTFNEEGHQVNENAYFVFGFTGKGKRPVGTFPTVESFYGDSGTALMPGAISQNREPSVLSSKGIQGQEAFGAIRFKEQSLDPGESSDYFVVMGIGTNERHAKATFAQFDSDKKFEEAWQQNKSYWSKRAHAITFRTGDSDFNSWMHWVALQPVLRRIFGCSFLPDHDYGKGGKGWRDIWQDLLSLIFIEPQHVRDLLVNYFAGVRIDGSNATILGDRAGEFLADRNAITRVWMDHGAWPLMTLALYINQTGDYDILLEENTYFRDMQLSRTYKKDYTWTPGYGKELKNKSGKAYRGTIIEHILVQHLVQFFNAGAHNNIRLENADWNDGFDMAFEKGESVAFTSFYGGNLIAFADLLEKLSELKNVTELVLAKEVVVLLDSLTNQPIDYDNADQKKAFLFDSYCNSVQPEISGEQSRVKIKDVIQDLRTKGEWIFAHIRKNEKVEVKKKKWFNGYYDNNGERVEGRNKRTVCMTLTGQVFPIMSGMANEEEIKDVIQAVQEYLKDEKCGNVRLNTDFGKPFYQEIGRAFGFAYGTKENGSFFSHMAVMYAYALYKRGFAREGHEVLQSIYRMGMDTEKSKIYPGIPEYFDSQGRGRYHYLTGAASWYVLTLLTQAFGISGHSGDLTVTPKLVAEEFNQEGLAEVTCNFAGKRLSVSIVNKAKLDYGRYVIKEVYLNDQPIFEDRNDSTTIKIGRSLIEQGPAESKLRIILG